VKPVGYFWENEWTGEEITDADFPMSHQPPSPPANGPIWCTQADLLRAVNRTNRAGFLKELEAKGEIVIVERAKSHKQRSLVQFSDPELRKLVERAVRDHRRGD
jgi:hypothetical protein